MVSAVSTAALEGLGASVDSVVAVGTVVVASGASVVVGSEGGGRNWLWPREATEQDQKETDELF